MNKLKKLLIILCSYLIFSACNYNGKVSDSEMNRRVTFLANNMDTTELRWFSQWNYSNNSTIFSNSNYESFSKPARDGYPGYECIYNRHVNKDSVTLKLIQVPVEKDRNAFLMDFPLSYLYNPQEFRELYFTLISGSWVQMQLDDTIVGKFKRDKLFISADPFALFENMSNTVEKYSIVKSKTNPFIGEFIEFNFGAGYKVLYLPDTSKLNPKYQGKQETIDRFEKGKMIKKGWSLVN